MEDIIVKQPKIEIKELNFYYSDFLALKNINLNIYEKEVMAFIGPSGCGKSTILRTLNRINDLIEGTRSKERCCWMEKTYTPKTMI